MNRITLALVAHEINRAYCAALGDSSHPTWAEASEPQKATILAGVDMHLANPDTTPQAAHESWLAQKTAEGWAYGPVKDVEAKVHPCFAPYESLPIEQRVKDHLFSAVVRTLRELPDAAAQDVVSAAQAGDAPELVVLPTPDGFLPIRYVGHRETYRDGLYGTGIVFAKGGTSLVPVDKARLMLKHPDVYKVGELLGAAPAAAADKPGKRAEDEDKDQDVRDSIAAMDKDALLTFAKTHFNVDLNKSKGVPKLRAEVTGMFDQYGLT